jgi:hypothetical protein
MSESVAARIARELRTVRDGHPHDTLEDNVSDLLDRDVIRAGPALLVRHCECGHSVFLHEIRKDGSRSRCYLIAGLRGLQCTCRNFVEAPHG